MILAVVSREYPPQFTSAQQILDAANKGSRQHHIFILVRSLERRGTHDPRRQMTRGGSLSKVQCDLEWFVLTCFEF
jgi:hypothetical protein